MNAPRSRRWPAPWMVGTVAMLVTLGGGAYMVSGLLKSKVAPSKQVVQEVRLIRPPPPPPDQPPPPPPPEEQVDVHEPVPQEEPTPSEEPPPGNGLNLDAEGSGAGDGFNLGSKPGGRDLLASGGSALSWYGGLIKGAILDRLSNEKKVRSGTYTIVVRVWVGPDGKIEKATLAGSSGDRERDRVIEAALSEPARLSQAPPANMPQPIVLRIDSRA
jgi:periplasmic protein TonB